MTGGQWPDHGHSESGTDESSGQNPRKLQLLAQTLRVSDCRGPEVVLRSRKLGYSGDGVGKALTWFLGFSC